MEDVQKILVEMGTMEIEKTELASYQLKDVAKSCCKMWWDRKALGRGPIIWELFKTTFMERFLLERLKRLRFRSSLTLSRAR